MNEREPYIWNQGTPLPACYTLFAGILPLEQSGTPEASAERCRGRNEKGVINKYQ
jgi:hypothetical protein